MTFVMKWEKQYKNKLSLEHKMHIQSQDFKLSRGRKENQKLKHTLNSWEQPRTRTFKEQETTLTKRTYREESHSPTTHKNDEMMFSYVFSVVLITTIAVFHISHAAMKIFTINDRDPLSDNAFGNPLFPKNQAKSSRGIDNSARMPVTLESNLKYFENFGRSGNLKEIFVSPCFWGTMKCYFWYSRINQCNNGLNS